MRLEDIKYFVEIVDKKALIRQPKRSTSLNQP